MGVLLIVAYELRRKKKTPDNLVTSAIINVILCLSEIRDYSWHATKAGETKTGKRIWQGKFPFGLPKTMWKDIVKKDVEGTSIRSWDWTVLTLYNLMKKILFQFFWRCTRKRSGLSHRHNINGLGSRSYHSSFRSFTSQLVVTIIRQKCMIFFFLRYSFLQ